MPFRLRPNVLRMEPYSPGKPIEEVKRELGLSEVVKLASNENPLGPSPKAVEAVRHAAEQMHLYPDASAFELRQAIAARYGVSPNQVLLGNGSDELIHLLGLVFLGGPEDEMIVGDPSFVRYDAAAQIADCRLIKVPLDRDLRHDTAAMASRIGPNTKLVWIANPNNPTGTVVDRQAVAKIFDRLPEGAALVLDEAYFEFAEGAPGYCSALDLIAEGKPVIGLRTFSKAYGLAGVRIGFGLAPQAVVDAIDRAREPFNCNSLAQAAAVAALDDHLHLEQTVALNAQGRETLNQAFERLGARPVQSYANFVCADLGRPAQPVFQALLKQGVIVRSGEKLGLPTYLRVSIGTELEIERFVHALERVLKETSPV